MSKLFQVPAVVQNLRTMADGGWRLQIDTRELRPEEATALMELHKKEGWMLFKENEISMEDIPEETAPEFNTDKSPSKRLRSVLFVYWKENTKQTMTFDDFYKKWMDKKIEEIKELLP